MSQKPKRRVIGSVVKSKEANKPDYIKIREKVTLEEGQCLSLESQKFQLERLQTALSAGKISEEMADKVKERLEKMPNWVRFDIVLVEKQQ